MFKTNLSGHNKIWGDTKKWEGALPPNAHRDYGPVTTGLVATINLGMVTVLSIFWLLYQQALQVLTRAQEKIL